MKHRVRAENRHVLCLAAMVVAAIVDSGVSARSAARAELPQDGGVPIEWAIRREAHERSQVSVTFRVLTDRFGGRVTGTPTLQEATEWARHQLRAWGINHVELQPWTFGHRGWTNQLVSVHMTAPRYASLHCEAVAWTPGTPGVVRAKAYALSLPLHPTKGQLNDYLLTHKERVKGRAVFVEDPEPSPRRLEEAPRLDERDLRLRLETRSSVSGRLTAPHASTDGGRRTLAWPDVMEEVDAFLAEARASLKVVDAQRPAGQVPARWSRHFGESPSVASVVMQSTDYGRLWRLLGDSFDVELEADVRNTFHDEGRIAHNVIAEIPGAESPNEVVMIGAHLDSWHVGTGATDNAIGAAIAMEVLRVLARVAGPPRKTIRLALWSGEEQGMLGSRAYVAAHYPPGSSNGGAPSIAYFNLDAGAGRVRGALVSGTPVLADRIRNAFAGTGDLGFVGVGATGGMERQSSDHVPFAERGLTTINLIQDPLDYATRTWHTNLDTDDAFEEQDAKDTVATLAIALYRLAVSAEQLSVHSERTR